MSWVWQHSTSEGIDRLVLLAIADAADDDGGNAWPSVATLARKTRVDPRTVQRAVRRLVAVGELTMRSNAGRNGVNVYRVTMTPGTVPPRQTATPGATPPRQDAAPAESPHPPAHSHPTPRHSATQPVLDPPTTRPTTSSSDAPKRADVERLCEHLADRIQANGSKRPQIGKSWRDAARLMLDTDRRTEQQIRNAIDWCQNDEFWRSNILSMPKLREQYDRLRLAAARGQPAARESTTDQRVRDGAALAQRLRAQQRAEIPA